MPSKSQAQHNFMEAAAHSKAFAKDHNISQATAKEFVEADKHNHHYQDNAKVSTEDKSNIGETIGRVKEMAKENHIPAERTNKIVKAAVVEASKEDVIDENMDQQVVEEHTPTHNTTSWLDGMVGANTDNPVRFSNKHTGY